MVKIKDGYVMNAREKAEFERVNALPRKTMGWVSYYFKPQTKYPPRIYVFMHSEIWCDRNRRPMGLHHAFPFLKRPMNKEEIEYHHFDTRLCYHQYEDWSKLIYAEEQEAERLDEEKAGAGSAFLEQLKAFQSKFPLGNTVATTNFKPQTIANDRESDLIRKLIENGQHYSVEEIGEMLGKEQKGERRIPVLILLRELYRSLADGNSKPLKITVEEVQQQAAVSVNRTRRNFVRRIFQANKLFALSEIREKYPEYSEAMLQVDLKSKSKRLRDQKPKPVVDYRRCQLQKLAKRLRSEN